MPIAIFGNGAVHMVSLQCTGISSRRRVSSRLDVMLNSELYCCGNFPFNRAM